ncbi:MAG: HAD-IC family P-type ATPase [Chromatiales bacterium]|nr:HAD-IC family P-type ATPase [Chromatiales bacterium]
MITGDNPLTAAAIAAEAGVDDFLAEATPEDKLELHPRASRPRARLVAMTGDGTNDAPALAQADVGGGDEHRHPGRARRPATWSTSTRNPTKLHRGRGDRQAAADHARRADHVLASPTTWPSTSPSCRPSSSPAYRPCRRSTSCSSTARPRRCWRR